MAMCHSMGVKMKKVMKRFIALLCVFVLAMSFTACKSSDEDNTSKSVSEKEDLSSVDAKKVLVDAYKNTAEQNGAKANMTLKLDLSAKEDAESEAQSIKLDTDVNIAASKEPIAVSIAGSAKGNFADTPIDGKAEIYFVTENDTPMVYVGYDMGTGMTWMYLELKDMISMDDLKSATSAADAQTSVDMFSDLKVEAVEKVNGKDCYKIVASLDKTGIDKAMETEVEGTTMKSAMESLYGAESYEQIMGMLKDFKLPVTYYVAKDGSTFEKCSIEMSETIKTLVVSILKQSGDESLKDVNVDELLTVNAASLDVTYANGETVEVKVPDEAKTNAIDASSFLAGGLQ